MRTVVPEEIEQTMNRTSLKGTFKQANLNWLGRK